MRIAPTAALLLAAVPVGLRLAPASGQTVRCHVSSVFHSVTRMSHRLVGRSRLLPSGAV